MLQVTWLLLTLILYSESRVLVKRSFNDQSVRDYLTEVLRPFISCGSTQQAKVHYITRRTARTHINFHLSAEVKNAWSYASTPPPYACKVQKRWSCPRPRHESIRGREQRCSSTHSQTWTVTPLPFCDTKRIQMSMPVAARSKAWVCGRSLAEIAGSNAAGGMDVCCECCVLSGRGLWDGLITRPEEYYRVLCVWVWSWILHNV